MAQISAANQNAFLARWTRGLFSGPRHAETFCQKVRSEEQAAASQGVLLILAEEPADTDSGAQDGMFGELEVSVDERERIVSDRAKLVKKIEKLSVAGEILTEIAAMAPELALVLSGAHGGIPGNRLRIDHLKTVAAKASTQIRQAAAVAQAPGRAPRGSRRTRRPPPSSPSPPRRPPTAGGRGLGPPEAPPEPRPTRVGYREIEAVW